jgi:RNA polymerase sigma-70 factor (ECF subfamily)
MGLTTIDEKWITRIAKGDGEAFQRVYEETSSVVFGFAMSILRRKEDAEDVMHDTFLSLYRNAGSYRPMGKPLAWILTIARNACYSHLKSRQDHAGLDQIREGTDPSADTSGSAESRLLLDAALRVLDDTECQVILLHAVSGWKHREIAAFLGIPLSTSLSKYRRGIEKMRRALEEKTGDAG